MKEISFSQVDSGDWKSAEVLAQALRHAPIDRGYNIGDVETAMRIIPKLSGTDLVLEDAEHAWLVQRVEKMQWTVASSEIIGLVKAVREAKQQ